MINFLTNSIIRDATLTEMQEGIFMLTIDTLDKGNKVLSPVTISTNSISLLIGKEISNNNYIKLTPPFDLENYIWLNEVEKDQIRIYFIPSKLIRAVK